MGTKLLSEALSDFLKATTILLQLFKLHATLTAFTSSAEFSATRKNSSASEASTEEAKKGNQAVRPAKVKHKCSVGKKLMQQPKRNIRGLSLWRKGLLRFVMQF
jgi:hypothetical protein